MDAVQSLLWTQVCLLIHDETWGKLFDLQPCSCLLALSSLWRNDFCYRIVADSAQGDQLCPGACKCYGNK